MIEREEKIKKLANDIAEFVKSKGMQKVCILNDTYRKKIDLAIIDTYNYSLSQYLINTDYGKVSEYKAEIERLNNEYNKAFERLKSQQQEIVALREENERLYIFKRQLEDELIERGWAEYDDNKIITLSDAVEEARKETAKEILNAVDNESNGQATQITNYLRKKYGVEVETK